MTKKVKCCTLFLCEFLLEGFSHEVFNETTCAIQLTNAMYSFLQEPFFPLGFRMEFLTRHVHIVVIGQGGVL
jgi:formate/nitrite transporter FocA (FNT family)